MGWPGADGEDWKDVEERPGAGKCATRGRSEASSSAWGLGPIPGAIALSPVLSAMRVASSGAKRITGRTSTLISRFLIGIRRSPASVISLADDEQVATTGQ